MADIHFNPDLAFHPENVAHNQRTLNYIRSTVASISGAVAGILGLTSYFGFGFYVLSSFFISLVIQVTNTGREPSLYFKNGWKETATNGLIGNAMSYLLFWTMFYGLVWVYEA